MRSPRDTGLCVVRSWPKLVRSLVPPETVIGFIEARLTDEVQPQHRDKFKQDVLVELDHLDVSRMGGLGITREQLEAWLNLRTPQFVVSCALPMI